MSEQPDGIIELDTDFAKELGFTSDLFGGYLWKDGDRILISDIFSKSPGHGNLSTLFDAIEAKSFRVAVPTPLPHMQRILKRKGFAPAVEPDEHFGEVEVWMKTGEPEPDPIDTPEMQAFIKDVLVQLDPSGTGLDEYIELVKQKFLEFEGTAVSEEAS